MPARVAAHPEISAQRKALGEHPFGSIKFWQEQRAFRMRGLEKVRGEFQLRALAYNMKRVMNIVGKARLLEEVRRLLAAAARRLGALLEALSARWPREEAEWPLAAREYPASPARPPPLRSLHTVSALGNETRWVNWR